MQHICEGGQTNVRQSNKAVMPAMQTPQQRAKPFRLPMRFARVVIGAPPALYSAQRPAAGKSAKCELAQVGSYSGGDGSPSKGTGFSSGGGWGSSIGGLYGCGSPWGCVRDVAHESNLLVKKRPSEAKGFPSVSCRVGDCLLFRVAVAY